MLRQENERPASPDKPIKKSNMIRTTSDSDLLSLKKSASVDDVFKRAMELYYINEEEFVEYDVLCKKYTETQESALVNQIEEWAEFLDGIHCQIMELIASVAKNHVDAQKIISAYKAACKSDEIFYAKNLGYMRLFTPEFYSAYAAYTKQLEQERREKKSNHVNVKKITNIMQNTQKMSFEQESSFASSNTNNFVDLRSENNIESKAASVEFNADASTEDEDTNEEEFQKPSPVNQVRGGLFGKKPDSPKFSQRDFSMLVIAILKHREKVSLGALSERESNRNILHEAVVSLCEAGNNVEDVAMMCDVVKELVLKIESNAREKQELLRAHERFMGTRLGVGFYKTHFGIFSNISIRAGDGKVPILLQEVRSQKPTTPHVQKKK